ncbi:MAG: hypothetical protein QXK86_07880 [Candidatus Bathyarchaeia archaeon]
MKRIYESLSSKIVKIRKIKRISISRSTYLNLAQAGIGLSIFLGVISSAVGWYGIATGKGIIFNAGAGTISFDPILTGLLTVVIGGMLTFEGIVLMRIILQVPRLIILSVVFGYCTLNIPAILLGLNHGLAAGVFAIIFGYLWLITVLAWLQRGE